MNIMKNIRIIIAIILFSILFIFNGCSFIEAYFNPNLDPQGRPIAR